MPNQLGYQMFLNDVDYLYFFKKDGVEYKGYVIHKIDKNNYIFNAKEVQDKDGQYKLRKFNITVLKQIVNKYNILFW